MMKNKSSEEEKKEPTQKGSSWNIRPYLALGLTVFLVLSLSILVFFLIYRYNGFAKFWGQVAYILQPIIIGVVLAYLLNPVMMFLERCLSRLIGPHLKKKERAKKICRSLATLGAMVVLVLVVAFLLVLIIPQIVDSIQKLVFTLPQEVQAMIKKMNTILSGEPQLADALENTLLYATDYLRDWALNDLLPKSDRYLTFITSGVIGVFKLLINILVGLIVSIYLLYSKEQFVGQMKKLTYAVFKPKAANIIVKTARKSNQIFGGFVSGKIVDSAIIGVLCYIVLLIVKMPYAVLVSVIVGVTNVIPFFGPFIGAVPSFFIILLANPVQGIYFLVIVLILQQVDGNIIGPAILGDSTGLSPFWVVFAIMIGGGLFGFMGMLLGVPVFGVIYYICEEVIYYFLRKKGLPKETEPYVKLEKVDAKTNRLCYQVKESDMEMGESKGKSEE